MTTKTTNIVIVGAGLVGSVMSIYLAKRGYNVRLFERRPDLRKEHKDSGRSINLALSNRGLKALKELGLEEKVRKMVIPMKGRMMHDKSGNLSFQPYGREGQAINSVSRGGLNELLLGEAEKAGVKILFSHKCLDVDNEKSTVTMEYNGQKVVEKGDVVIGADGAFSSVRNDLQRSYRFNYSQHFLDHGYKEMEIPAGSDGTHRLEKNALHIWPRGKFMFIALPNLDGSFTCTLFFPFEGETSFDSLKTDQDVLHFFKETFPDALEEMPDLLEDFNSNPTSSLVTIKCFPWKKNRTLLIGDASHAIVPFYGQGMNAGFEDCRLLNALIDQHEGQWDTILDTFQKNRKPDADAISDLAIKNFLEMRDLVSDSSFLLRKKIEAKLHELFPDRWIPLYSMVTFHENINYSDAMKIGTIQKRVMDEVMKTNNLESNWQTLDFNKIIGQLEKLKP